MKKQDNIKAKRGFTIIEVVLVLAIAGLIFLMVFVALPNLQRTQRDTQRRNDLDRVATSLTQYITNNNRLPGTDGSAIFVIGEGEGAWSLFANKYLLADGEDTFVDPNGDPYQFEAIDCEGEGTECSTASLTENFGTETEDNVQAGIIVVAINARCGDDVDSGNLEEFVGARAYATAMKLEGNGVYCVDNR